MYAENSDKTLVKVIPNVYNVSGYTKSWEVHMEYSFPAVGYTTSSAGYASTVVTTVGVSTLNLAPTGFTSTGIIDMVNSRLDYIFDYEYQIANGIHPDSRTVQVGFAITQLSS